MSLSLYQGRWWATYHEAELLSSGSVPPAEEVTGALIFLREEFAERNGDSAFYKLYKDVYAFPAFGWWLIVDYDRQHS